MSNLYTINNEDLVEKLRVVPNFPKEGIQFYDIAPLLADAEGLRLSVDRLAALFSSETPEVIVGIDARGFILASALAYKLGCGLALIRKKGKLPFSTYSQSYALEYGQSTLEIHTDTFKTVKRALLIDDLLATGGTAKAAAELAEKAGGQVMAFGFLIELLGLRGKEQLKGINTKSLMRFD